MITEEDARLTVAWLCGLLGVDATPEELKNLPKDFQARVLGRASVAGVMLDAAGTRPLYGMDLDIQESAERMYGTREERK